MGYSLQSIQHEEQKKRRPVRVVHIVNDQTPERAWLNSLSAEEPQQVKQEPPLFIRGFLRVLQGFINTLLLLILILALIILVLAFAYQMVYAPEVLVAWSQNLINSVIRFFQHILPV